MDTSGRDAQGEFYRNLNQLGDDCQARLTYVNQDLQKGVTQVEGLLKSSAVDNLQPCLNTLNQGKQEVLDLVNKYFADLEKQVRAHESQKVPREQLEKKAETIFTKIAERQNVLFALSKDLNVKEKCLETMKIVREPGFEAENQRIQKEIDDFQALLINNPTRVTKDSHALPFLNQQLAQFVYLDEQKPQNPSTQAPRTQTGQRSQVVQEAQGKLTQRELGEEWDKSTKRQTAREKDPFQSFSPKFGEGPTSSSLIIERQEQTPYYRTSPHKKVETPNRDLFQERDLFQSPVGGKKDRGYNQEYSSPVRDYGSPTRYNPHYNPHDPQQYGNLGNLLGHQSPNAAKRVESPLKTYSPEKKGIVVTETSFDPATSGPYLHFFQDNSKKLHVLDLKKAEKTNDFTFEEINLDINFKIPVWHRSVITRQGTIYLTGGADPNSKEQINFSDVYVYDPMHKTLKPHSKMNFGRNSHGICVLQNYMYVVGGCLKQGGYGTSCERVEIGHYHHRPPAGWRNIAPLNKPACGPCVTSFNDTHIYKFGGYFDLTKLNNSVERYDPREDRWTEISYNVFGSNRDIGFYLMGYASCLQTNEEEILVFGGSNFDRKSDQIYTFRPNNKGQEIHRLDQVLPERGTFWSNAVIFGGRVYGLQNVQLSNGESYYLNKRRIVRNNGKQWEQVNKEYYY